jgi:cellulose synthase/poly-beta-1,6-N-acetylglucosamine synthase-like glycosyltransferase/uncharacterized membrane protein
VIEVTAIVFGAIWLAVNFYNFYPLAHSWVGSRFESSTHFTEGEFLGEEFPSIDVLLPAYREGPVIEQSIATIREADFPQECLDLTVLVEPGDEDTESALAGIAEAYSFDTLVVPEEYPGDPNKPRALNYGFEKTDGDIVGVIDAEDIVSPDLFQKVCAALVTDGYDYAQGMLDVTNEQNGWKNMLFRGEYGFWYQLILPTFYRAGYPIPLGGTTNFFHRTVLREISEERERQFGSVWDLNDRHWLFEHGLDGLAPWDPSNVTEDFELGQFLWYEGYELAFAETVTKEASPLTIDGWIKQRTRWQKGKIYTFFQYLKRPPTGTKARTHLLGQSALPHLGPINVLGVVVLAVLANGVGYEPSLLTSGVLTLGVAFAVSVMGMQTYGYYKVSDRSTTSRLLGIVTNFATLPAYWLLQWYADLRAIRQFYFGQNHWEKTAHHDMELDIEGIYNSFSVRDLSSRIGIIDWQDAGKLGVIVAVAFLIRVYDLTRESLWLDEITAITAQASLPLDRIIATSAQEFVRPPLYSVLLHYWIEFFGSSPFTARLLSVLFGTGAVLLMYKVGYELYSSYVGVLAALLLSLSTIHIQYSRMIEGYSVFVFFALLSMYYFVRLLGNSRSASTIAGYLVSTVLLCYTHLFGVFFVLAQNVFVASGLLWRGSDHDFSLSRWIGLQGLVGVLFAPWIVRIEPELTRFLGEGEVETIAWISLPGTETLLNTFLLYANHLIEYPFALNDSTSGLLAVIVLALFAVLSWQSIMDYRIGTEEAFSRAERQRRNYLLALWVLVPIGAPFALSYLFDPVYLLRYTLPASGGLYLLAASGVEKIRNNNVKIAIVVVLIVASLATTGIYYQADTQENWQGVGNYIDAQAETDDLLLTTPAWVEQPVRYYSERTDVTIQGISQGGAGSGAAATNYSQNGTTASAGGPKEQAPIARIRENRTLNDTNRVWLITSSSYEQAPQLLKAINNSESYALRNRRSFASIDVYVFGPTETNDRNGTTAPAIHQRMRGFEASSDRHIESMTSIGRPSTDPAAQPRTIASVDQYRITRNQRQFSDQ